MNDYIKMENEEEDDMGLQLALKKARKLKQLETIDKKPNLADLLVVSYFYFWISESYINEVIIMYYIYTP